MDTFVWRFDLQPQHCSPLCLFFWLSFSLFAFPVSPQGGGATETGADVRTFMAFGSQVKEQRCHPAGATLPQLGWWHQRRCVFVHVFAFTAL